MAKAALIFERAFGQRTERAQDLRLVSARCHDIFEVSSEIARVTEQAHMPGSAV